MIMKVGFMFLMLGIACWMIEGLLVIWRKTKGEEEMDVEDDKKILKGIGWEIFLFSMIIFIAWLK